MVTTFYILGTKAQPEGLIRHVRDPGPGNLTYAMFDPRTREYVANADAGGWILSGDLMLTRIGAHEVAGVKRRLVERTAAAPS